ncbi:hypothetical protein [Pseudoxanthomonas sp. UTMC 1351]|uniref:hypothetical protein n=1 Tax=Pseudoxanthomonas sp. UTMC 1351 TaxID=2695853 RepID=UPI0034CEDE98
MPEATYDVKKKPSHKSEAMDTQGYKDEARSAHALPSKQLTTSTERKKSPQGLNRFGLRDQTEGRRFLQLPAPDFKKDTATAPELRIDKTLALVHGINLSYASAAIENNFLQSAYARIGPNESSYHRPSDLRGGGAMGVYTRAVGIATKKWSATGMGVGSGKGMAQLVIKPDVLLDGSHVWRAASMDNMGMVPGSTKTDGLNAQEKWQQQSKPRRNRAFNDSVIGDIKENNEQLHWEKLPLDGLKAIIIHSGDKVPSELRAAAERRNIPIITASDSDTLKRVLHSTKLIDEDGKWTS